MKTGTKMGMDSHADTTCVNKHAFIESVIGGLTVDAIPFDDSIGKMSNLPIVHAIYAYDDPESLRTFLLQFNNAIYNKNMKKCSTLTKPSKRTWYNCGQCSLAWFGQSRAFLMFLMLIELLNHKRKVLSDSGLS